MNQMLNLRPEPAEGPLIDIEAEQALLGCIIFDNSARRALDGLEPRHFHEPVHQRLFTAIIDRIDNALIAEPHGLAEKMRADEAFTEMGGARFLGDLVDRAPPTTAAPSIGESLMALALRRDLVAAATAMIAAARGEGNAYETASEAQGWLDEIAQGSAPGDANLVDARSSVETTLDAMDIEADQGIAKGKMTGLRCFDRRLGGLKPGHLIVVGGRPSMAKTGLARVAAYGCAARNPRDTVAYFALEMERRELDERTLAELSFLDGDGVPYQDMSRGKVDPMTRRRLRDLAWKVPKNCIIDDSSSLSLDYITRRVWSLKRKGNLVAIFIDYLQIMRMAQVRGRTDTALIGDVTKGLKNLARAAEICVVLLSQLSRQVEQRDDKKPMLSDLRDSGSIEQDANAVLFPFREVYYVERAEPKKTGPEHSAWEETVELLRRKMDVICAKNRGGAVGIDHQEYFAEFDVIRDVVEDR